MNQERKPRLQRMKMMKQSARESLWKLEWKIAQWNICSGLEDLVMMENMTIASQIEHRERKVDNPEQSQKTVELHWADG